MDLKEVDVCMLPHALHTTKRGVLRIVLLSNDADVLVWDMHAWALLECHGLRKLWMTCGVGYSPHYIPNHG